eukprot:2541093-Pyramimonas_sp.AAC.1
MEVPADMSDLFSLPVVDAGVLESLGVPGVPGGPGDAILPCLRVMPMGFNWAMRVCQACLCNVVRDAGFVDSDL